MKLFKYQMGSDEKLGAAKDEQDAYDRRAEVDHTFNFLPVQITEVKIDGYEVTLKPVSFGKSVVEGIIPKQRELNDLDTEGLKAWLDERSIKYHWNSGEDKLRELALKNV